ncbi:hypothetical protein ES703_13588 [subsurface metagenome]
MVNKPVEVKKAGGNGHKTNWLQVLKNSLADILADTATIAWGDITTIDGIVDDIKASLADGGFTDLLIDAIKAETALIVADTNEIQVSLADGGFTDLLIDAIKGVVDDILADTATIAWGDITTIDGIVDDIKASLADGGFTDLLIDAIKGVVDDILADTEVLTLANIEAEVVDALESFDLDHLLKVALGNGLSGFVGNDTVLGHFLAKADVANFNRTTDSLEALGEAIAAIAGVNSYQEQIPDTDFDLDTIPEDLASDPPGAPAENSVVDIDVNAGDTFVLRSLFVEINSFGTGGNKLIFKLWTLLNTAVTMVDEVDVTSLGIQNLADIFGLQEVHGDGIWITVQSDATPGSDDADCEGTYRWAKAS